MSPSKIETGLAILNILQNDLQLKNGIPFLLAKSQLSKLSTFSKLRGFLIKAYISLLIGGSFSESIGRLKFLELKLFVSEVKQVVILMTLEI